MVEGERKVVKEWGGGGGGGGGGRGGGGGEGGRGGRGGSTSCFILVAESSPFKLTLNGGS